ncbi:EAL domain-containing protein [Marinobacteraceae bacterium S3BR75-40.1]
MKEILLRRYRSDAFEAKQSPGAVVRLDDQGGIIWADANVEHMFGYDAYDLRDKPIRQLVATRQDDPMMPFNLDPLERGEDVMVTFRHQEGYFFSGILSLRVNQMDADQASEAMIHSRANDPLDERLLKIVEDSGQLGVWELDIRSNQIAWSDGMYRILDLRRGQDVDPDHAMFYFQEAQARVRAAIRRCIQRGKPFTLELPVLTGQQRRRWVRLTGRALRQGEQIQSVAGTLIDITETREEQEATEHWQQLLKGLLSTSDDLIVAVAPDLSIIFLNQTYADQFENTFGLRPKVGDNLLELLQDNPNERRLYQRLWERAFERDDFCVEMPLAQQDRELPVYEIHYHRLTDAKGELIGAAHVAHNMSTRLRVADNLNYLSRHDPMTGLLNRREFIARLKRGLRIAADKGNVHSLLYLDLDGFTQMNEEHGASACDRYIRELANLLASRVRQRDALARIGGDKFAVLLDNCGDTEARSVSDTLFDVIRSFRFDWRGKTLSTTVSGGLVAINHPDQFDAEQLLALAADLCQTAKNAGRARIHVHRDKAIEVAEDEARRLVQQLQERIHEDAVELFYQAIRPIASVTWGDYIEIFARLRIDEGPQAGLWEPSEFLPIAERFDLARELDRAVIRKTVAWLARHPLLEPRLKLCSFNVSLASLQDDSFPETVAELLQSCPFPPDRFCFEIAESDAARNPEEVLTACKALQSLGCKVALDGTGGAGQSYALIAQLPVDVIKLDGRLMKSVRKDPVQLVMVEALHKVAEVSGRLTIAQFIEDDEALREVRQLGIHFGQGYRLAPPRPLEELAPVSVSLEGHYPKP